MVNNGDMKNRLFTEVALATLLLIVCSSAIQARGVCNVTLKASKPLSEQLTTENTIYVVKSDFDLKGDTVVFPMPEGQVSGISLSNSFEEER